MAEQRPSPDERYQRTKELRRQLYELRSEMQWQKHYAEYFFARKAVEKYPDEADRELRMWESHQRKMILGWNPFYSFEVGGMPHAAMEAHIKNGQFLKDMHGDNAWAWAGTEKEMQEIYGRAAARAGLSPMDLIEKLGSRPSEFERLRELPDTPILRLERDLSAFKRTDEGHRELCFAAESTKLLTLEFEFDWTGIMPGQKREIISREVKLDTIPNYFPTAAEQTAKRLWEHTATRRAELGRAGTPEKWVPIGYVARDETWSRVLAEFREQAPQQTKQTPERADGKMTLAKLREQAKASQATKQPERAKVKIRDFEMDR